MRAADLAELERIAHAANDRATLDLIELAEDAAGVEAERVRERRADKLCDARGVTELRAKLDAQTERMHAMQRQLDHARELDNIVGLVLRPFTGKTAPRWAESLRAVRRRIALEQAR